MLRFLADHAGTVVVAALLVLASLRRGRGAATSRAPGLRSPDFLAPWTGDCRGAAVRGSPTAGGRTCGISSGSGSEPKGH